jgi:hypothetical protein
MSKAAPKKAKSLAQLFLDQQRALEAGKAGYQRADFLLELLEAEMQAGRLKVGAPIDLGNGQTGVFRDKFAEKSTTSTGMKVRRYEVEISRAADIASKL